MKATHAAEVGEPGLNILALNYRLATNMAARTGYEVLDWWFFLFHSCLLQLLIQVPA